MSTGLQIAISIISPVAAIAAAVIALMRVLGRLDRRLDHLEIISTTVENQNRALLTAFPSVISSLMRASIMTADQGTNLISTALGTQPISDLLGRLKPTINPLSQADLDGLKSYVFRLKQGQVLTREEAQDFYRLSDIITREYPNTPGSWLLFLIGGILIGAPISNN